ncbi:MAG TPA: carboxypeptidase-like regulatory domain-containing protein [Polyangia bacterium]|nr:carboxypeptidase-like regulatory domain-containing protein [Polyangia bacterium]
MRKLAFVLGLVGAIGCGDNQKVAVSNTNPLGTVGGVVLDLEGEAPIMGATVTLQTAGTMMMAMTDMNGVYTFAKVPAGELFVNIAAPGYESAYVPGQLSGAVGNFPVSNPQTTMPTVELFKTSGTFAVALVDDRGAPVAGVTVTARPQVKYYAYDYPYNGTSGFPSLLPFGTYAVTATSDATGVATFSGLPSDYALNLIDATEMFVDVPPIVIMGTSTYQFAGASFAINPTHVTDMAGGPASTYTIRLVGANAALQPVSASIDYLVGKTGTVAASFGNAVASLLKTTDPISITFNQAVDQSSLRAQLLDENGVSLGNMMATFPAGNIVQLAAPPAYMAGRRYNLVLHAAPLSQAGSMGTPLNVTAPFFTAGPDTLAVTATLSTLPVAGTTIPGAGKIVLLTFSEAVGLGKGASPALGCTAWYDGIDLDNSGAVSYQGEYSPTALPKCPDPTGPIVFDMTRLQPYEPNPQPGVIPTTGFTNKWYTVVDDTVPADGCKTGQTTCTKPASATMMHLLFSHLDSTQTVTRANGQAIGDMNVAIQ